MLHLAFMRFCQKMGASLKGGNSVKGHGFTNYEQVVPAVFTSYEQGMLNVCSRCPQGSLKVARFDSQCNNKQFPLFSQIMNKICSGYTQGSLK